MTIQRIISVTRGSWKWQDAYAVAAYAPTRTKDGRWVWQSVGRVTGKMSMPQIRRTKFANLECGGLHHKPINQDDMRMFAIA